MRYILKPAGYAIWLMAMVISGVLAWEFHQGHVSIGFAIACLALAVSAFGLLFARDAWENRALPECAAGVALWTVGAAFFAITEWGYWDGSYSQHYEKYQQTTKALARVEELKDQRWKALTTGEFQSSPGQIEAQINAAKMSERWQGTKQCTEATSPASKDFCKGYFELQGKLAGAQQRSSLEDQFSKVSVEQKAGLVHNILAGADVIARRFKLEPRLAADIVIFAAWILLFLGRDLGALIADPIGTRKRDELKSRWRDLEEAEAAREARIEARTAVVVPPRPLPAEELLAPVPAAFQASQASYEQAAKANGMQSWLVSDDDPLPPPPSGGKPVEEKKAETKVNGEVFRDATKNSDADETAAFFDDEEDGEPPVIDYDTKLRLTKKEQRKRKLAMVAAKKKISSRAVDDEPVYVDVETWASLLLRKGRPEDQITSKDCRVNIQDYAEMHGYHMPDKKVLSAQISAVIDKLNGVKHEKGKRRPRTNKGVVWHGWYLLDASCLLNMSPERARA
jgi:hypothetical protein